MAAIRRLHVREITDGAGRPRGHGVTGKTGGGRHFFHTDPPLFPTSSTRQKATTMKLVTTTFAAAVATLVFGLGTAHATTIINLDATQGTGVWQQETDAATVKVSLAAGTYTVSVIDNTANGGYNGYSFNTGMTIREAFDYSINGASPTSVDVGASKFTSYATSADALAAFKTGPYHLFSLSNYHYDATPGATLPALTFTLAKATDVTFGIPDNQFGDNQGGVSLAITAAVPEPETYALMLAGLGALGMLARRRKFGG